MPRKSVPGAQYPANWRAIATAIKEEAGWRCVRCGGRHHPPECVLTVHHLNMDPRDSDPARFWWNLIPLCARCHLSIQARVDLTRPWVLLPHSAWFRPYVAGWYAWRYAGLLLTREEVMARLDELLALERAATLGGAS